MNAASNSETRKRHDAARGKALAAAENRADTLAADLAAAVQRAERAEAEVERLASERDDWIDRYETSHASLMHAEDCYRRERDAHEALRAAVARVFAAPPGLCDSCEEWTPVRQLGALLTEGAE